MVHLRVSLYNTGVCGCVEDFLPVLFWLLLIATCILVDKDNLPVNPLEFLVNVHIETCLVTFIVRFDETTWFSS